MALKRSQTPKEKGGYLLKPPPPEKSKYIQGPRTGFTDREYESTYIKGGGYCFSPVDSLGCTANYTPPLSGFYSQATSWTIL